MIYDFNPKKLTFNDSNHNIVTIRDIVNSIDLQYQNDVKILLNKIIGFTIFYNGFQQRKIIYDSIEKLKSFNITILIDGTFCLFN